MFLVLTLALILLVLQSVKLYESAALVMEYAEPGYKLPPIAWTLYHGVKLFRRHN